MKRVVLVAALALSLSACGGGVKLSSLIDDAKAACSQIAPILSVASLVPEPRVQSIIGFANSMCGPLSAGAVPPSLDANTPQWLGQLGGMLKALTGAR